MLDRVKGRAVDLGYAAGWGVVKYVPSGLSERSFRAIADAATVRNGAGARQLRKNLRRVVGPSVSELRLDQIVGEALRSYSRYWRETFRLPRMDLRALAERTDEVVVGAEHLDAALERGKGVVLALPHQGNYDAAGVWLVHHNGPFVTVAERLKPESLFERFVEFRESLGFEVHPVGKGTPSPIGVLQERMGENKVACLLADRDLSRNGVQVDFFGEPTRMPPGPAILAATTGAALLPVSAYYAGDGWGLTINPPIEVPDLPLNENVQYLTQQVAQHFEVDIAAHPTDWHMLQKLWLSDLRSRPQ
jgi:KDO2-lipid IV(A) lauroyltransferase